RLNAAGALLQARLALLWAQAEPARRNLSLFIDQPVGGIDIDGVNISATFQDADLQPDANQLSTAEWARLLGAYGMAEAESQRLAERIDALRQQPGGYESIVDLAGTPNLPLNLRQGFEASGELYPALADLLTAGGASRRLHIADSPLALFVAFNATPDQIGRLRDIRRQRQPTLADARLIFGGEFVKMIYEGSPEKLRARLAVGGVPLRLEFEVSVRNGQLAVTPPQILTTT
ncbi:MAG: hypothetical protein D4S02_11860, partial [Rhodocyclaceae bacterium]